MKDRVRLLRDELRRRLPEPYPQALAILLKSVRAGTLAGRVAEPHSLHAALDDHSTANGHRKNSLNSLNGFSISVQ